MKNLTKIFMVVAVALFAFSCVQNATEDLGIKVEGQGVKELTLSLEASRTQLGEKADGLYPLYWSEGDAISVNGEVSLPLAGVATDATSATFQFYKEVARPLCVVYPAAAVATVEEGEATEPAPVVAYPVNFLATQPYTVGTFAPQAAPMYGYAAALAEGEEETPLQLNHLTGVLRLALKGNGEKVTSIKVKAEKGVIAGPFAVDCTNGALTAQEGASNTVTVTFAEGLVLGAEAQAVYLTVPAGKYGTFVITVNTEAHQKMTVKFNSDVKPINAGAVREFSEFEYAANNADVDEGDFIIDGKDALIEFARIASTFYPRTKAVVTADIDMTGYDWTPIASFGEYEFDGGNFAIKGLNAPLFASTAANIKDLKVTDVNIVVTDLAHSGAIACDLIGGSLYNCYTSGNVEINNTTFDKEKSLGYYKDVCHGGVVGFANGATLEKCENYINLTVNSAWKEDTTPTEPLQLAASAMFGVVDNGVTITECNNYGALTINAAIKEGKHIAVGGVLASTSSTNDLLSITNCTNHGAITLSESFKSPYDYFVGGVAAIIQTGCQSIKDLTNLGTIIIKGNSITDAETLVAGVVADGYDSMENLVNGSETNPELGAITVAYASEEGYPNDKTYIAGVAGRVGLEIKNCKNYAKITTTGTTSDNTYIGGVLGSVYSGKPEVMDKCYNYGDLHFAGAKSAKLYMGGLISQSWNSTTSETTTTISNSENKGDLIADLKEGLSIGKKYVAGIFGMQESGSGCGGVKTFKLVNVVNSGNIFFADRGTTSECFVSGIFGNCTGQKNLEFEGSENKGTVYVGYTRNAETKKAEAMTNAVVGGAAKFSMIVGGWGGTYNKAINTIAGGAIKINSQFLTSDQVHVGGFGGYGGSPYDAVGCTFAGEIEFNENSSTANALHLGGYFGYFNDNTETVEKNIIKECTVAKSAKIVMAGSVANELRMSGMVAWVKKNKRPMEISGCSNYGTLELTKTATGCTTTAIGGILGKPEAKTINLIGCWNEGDIKVAGKKLTKICIGGIIGNNYSGVITASTSTEYPYFYNSGKFIVGNTGEGDTALDAASYICAGGFCGYHEKTYTLNAGFSNYGDIVAENVKVATNFYIGGCLGLSKSAQTMADGVKFVNTGNITVKNVTFVKGSGASIFVGGIDSSAKATIYNSECYCDISAVGLQGKVGMLVGNSRTDAIYASGCKIGGNLILAEEVSEEIDASGDTITTVAPVKIPITADNYYEYIYNTAVSKAVAEGDECSYLSVKPTVTLAPQPAN